MNVLVAPTAFKGTLSPFQAARAIARGIRAVFRKAGTLEWHWNAEWPKRPARPEVMIALCPVADGGDGTREVLTWNEMSSTQFAVVRDPLMRKVRARWSQTDCGRALFDMADASGLKLVPPARRNPLVTTTYGTGQLIRAVGRGPGCVVGLGGSATVDGGTGALTALGVRFLDAQGRQLPPGGGALVRLARIDASRLARAPCVTLLTDVRNRLLGPHGAARVFGPQKGAIPADVARLEHGLARLRDVAFHDLGVDLGRIEGGGAAGGLAAGLAGILGARIVPGAPFVLRAIGFARALASADLVLTGEGGVDSTTLDGKAVGAVIDACRRRRVPVAVICGECRLPQRALGATVVETMGRAGLRQPAEALAGAAAGAVRKAVNS